MPLAPLRRILIPFILGLTSAPAADLLRYVIRAEPFEIELTLPDGTRQTRPLPRQPTHFFHRANNRWPIPDGPAATPVRCHVQWIGFPDGFRLINSYDIDRREQQFDTTLGQLRKAVFTGGGFRTVTTRRGLVLVTRDTWKIPDATIVDWIDRLALAHTALWKDRGLAGHRVWIVPTTGNAGGEGRTRGAIVEVNPESFSSETFARSLSHELFHEWNPRRLHYGDNEELYWFTEGFTDYYSILNLRRSGIWTFAQTVDYVNEVLRVYYTSPARNFTPRQMVEARRSDFSAERLPYHQGLLLAAHWNLTGQSLDRAMRLLRKDTREPLSNARIARALRDIGLRNAESEIQRFIEQGRTIELRPRLWGACAAESTLAARGFELGFNAKESRDGIVRGVRPESNAWRAGLRDGQKWKPIDVSFNDPTYQADLEIADQQGTRRIRFHPATAETIAVTQYKATTERCANF